MGEGNFEDGPFEGELLPAQDRLWRHPAERGAAQAAANLEARRAQGRRWPSNLMSFIAGCTIVGLAWLLQEDPQAEIVVNKVEEVAASEPSLPEGPLSFDEWANDIAETNRHAVVGLLLGGQPEHQMAQGILLSTDGHIITSAHSLLGAENITARVPGLDRPAPAPLVASDPVSGIAVLKINAPDLPPPVFDDNSAVLLSDVLVALAHHGEQDTDSLARTVSVLGVDQVIATPQGDLLSGLFRLSDELGPEWAGSAVLEDSGGIVAMTVENRDGRHHAIPIRQARRWAQELIETGTIDHRAWLGIDRSPITTELLDRRNLLGGVLVQRVWSETPAARAGLVAGDIIVGAGPVNVLDMQDLVEYLATLSPGDPLELRFSRTTGSGVGPAATDPAPEDILDEIMTTTVILGARPA